MAQADIIASKYAQHTPLMDINTLRIATNSFHSSLFQPTNVFLDRLLTETNGLFPQISRKLLSTTAQLYNSSHHHYCVVLNGNAITIVKKSEFNNDWSNQK